MASSDHEEAHARLLQQLGMMLRALLASPVGRTLVLLALGLLLIIVATAYGQVILNGWNRPFYDAISRRDIYGFLYQLGVFCVIAGSLLVLNVMQAWVQEMSTLKLREGLVRDLLHGWMLPRRALMLANAGPIGINPDQRMHEDARRLCELSVALGSGLLQSSILLLTFIGVLWGLSSRFVFHVGAHAYALPGYMVWAALAYAAFGSLLSYRVGRTLIPRNAERYSHEADLRFSLVRVNEHLDGISLASGEAGEMRRVDMHLNDVLRAMRRLVTGLTNLTWITAGFGWATVIAPIIVASPLYFEGTLSFGGLMQAAAAFTQAQSSLSWFVNNFSTIADWRAILMRVANFRRALLTADELGPDEKRIEYTEGEPGELLLENLEVASPTERDVLDESTVTVRAGERLLILAEPGTGRTRLFRALAGLWPWGTGRIIRPRGEQIVYWPRGTPYLPRGTLREVLAYPASVESFPKPSYAQSLRRVALERLVPLLDETRRWDRELSQEDQFGLAFARIVLQRPGWLIIDDTLGTLDDETLALAVDVFSHELAATSVIHIGSARARDPLFTRTIRLTKRPGTQRLRRPIGLLLLVGLVGLLWPLIGRAATSPAENFQFHAPTTLDNAATVMVMRDLAVRVLPVYADPMHLRYLTNLSALQLVAGDYASAYATRQALRAQLRGATPAQSPEQSVAFDIYAHTEALEQRTRVPFGDAFTQSFNGVIPQLDDLTDYTVTSWLQLPLAAFQDNLASAFQSVRSQNSISLPQALELVWTYLSYQMHLATAPQADVLIASDDQRRYITEDDVLIKSPHGPPLVAMLVRPRSGAQPLSSLLEFTIYAYADNDAKENAAHGYVGVVAYSRGKRIDARRVQPYVYDGEDAHRVIDWIAHQPWSDGRVAMYGSGYSAFSAWAAAQHAPAALRAIAIASPLAPGIDDPDRDNIFLNSAYRWARYVGDTADLNDTAYADSAHWLSLDQTWYRSGRPYADLPRIEGQPNALFSQWLAHPNYDHYWQTMIPYGTQFAHIDLPVLMISGYYDRNQAGALYYFTQHHHYDPKADDTLVMGPYDENITQGPPPAYLRGYALDSVALVNWHALRYQWFDAVLRGTARPALTQGRINYEVIGANQWRQADSLQNMANGTLRFYLDSRASDLRTADWHLLATQIPAAASALTQVVNFADRDDATWTAPTSLQGSSLPTHYSNVFVSAPFSQAMQLDGQLSGQLDVMVNKVDFDFTLQPYVRFADGTLLQLYDPPDEYRASYVASPIHRHPLAAGVRQRLSFVSQHIAGGVLPPGSRLLLVLSINKRPDQEINYGSTKPVSQQSIADAKEPLRVRWFGRSFVDLPVRSVPLATPAPAAAPPTPPASRRVSPSAPAQPPTRSPRT